MTTFALIALFSAGAIVAALSLVDSAAKGVAAYRRLKLANCEVDASGEAHVAMMKTDKPTVERAAGFQPAAQPRKPACRLQYLGLGRSTIASTANQTMRLPVAA